MQTYKFTRPQLTLVLNETIRLFIECRDKHRQSEAAAQTTTVAEILVGLDAERYGGRG
jgi:hypothetical protein